jgi:intraflagellar transport protein 88
VLFNLAIQYTNNEMYTEAIATYQAITRNKMFNTPNNANSANRLKVNMANIYVKMGQLSQAIKMYRMSFDQTTTAHKDLR